MAKKKNWEWIIQWINEYKVPPSSIAQNQSMRLLKRRGNSNYL